MSYIGPRAVSASDVILLTHLHKRLSVQSDQNAWCKPGISLPLRLHSTRRSLLLSLCQFCTHSLCSRQRTRVAIR